MNFEELNLAPAIVRAVREQGYETPTPIQAQAIPAVLAGQDLLAGAQTGTGKTAAFTLPLLHRLSESERAKNRFGGIAIRALGGVGRVVSMAQRRGHEAGRAARACWRNARIPSPCATSQSRQTSTSVRMAA